MSLIPLFGSDLWDHSVMVDGSANSETIATRIRCSCVAEYAMYVPMSEDAAEDVIVDVPSEGIKDKCVSEVMVAESAIHFRLIAVLRFECSLILH